MYSANPEFQQYNKKLYVRFSTEKRELDATAASIPTPYKKVRYDSSPVTSPPGVPLPAVPGIATAASSFATAPTTRLFSSRGGKAGAGPPSLRGIPATARRVFPPTGNVFQDELLKLVSDLVEVTREATMTVVMERTEDEEVKKNYFDALSKNETLRIQEETLLAERRAQLLEARSAVKIGGSTSEVECRIQVQENFWLGEEKKGSMKERLERLEMFVNSETSEGGFQDRLLSLEIQSGAARQQDL